MVPGFKKWQAPESAGGFDVYSRGDGPTVLVMHEIPGITSEVYGFANRLVERGFHVAMPHLFGEDGSKFSFTSSGREIARACIGKEFHVLAANESSPIVDKLKALARHLHEVRGGRGVGAIGMCLTGNFALAMMVDTSVVAPVLCQPSLPFAITPRLSRALHVSEEDLQAGIRRASEENVDLMGLRFTHDVMCPNARFVALRRHFGKHFVPIEIDSGPGNAHGIPLWAHSVMAHDFIAENGHPTQQAFEALVAFFHKRLATDDSNEGLAVETTTGAT